MITTSGNCNSIGNHGYIDWDIGICVSTISELTEEIVAPALYLSGNKGTTMFKPCGNIHHCALDDAAQDHSSGSEKAEHAGAGAPGGDLKFQVQVDARALSRTRAQQQTCNRS